MELFVDERRADMDRRTTVSLSVSVASVTSPEYGRTGYTKGISIPMTAANRNIMGDCEQVNACRRFNSSLHTGRIEEDGCVIMEGSIMLTACEKDGDAGRYVFTFIGAGKNWASHAVRNHFTTLFPAYSARIGASQIVESWTAPVPVRWLPVQRERYIPQNSSAGIYSPGRVLSESDYHPFIHIRSALHAIFADAGYELVSDFLDSDYFDSLYMSGAYPRRDVSPVRRRMDFMASRFGEAEASADNGGRVFANPFALYNTIGNIVDTADPDEERDGVKAEGVFNNGGCFRRDGERVAFYPDYKISVGFEYRIKYVTQYRIVSRSRLAGFDRVYLGNGQLHDFILANPFPDRRGEFRPGKEFLCVVCEYEEGAAYRLLADHTSPTGGGSAVRTLAQFYSKTIKISTIVEGTYGNLRLQKKSDAGDFADFGGEWALYDGYVTESGETEVEIVLRSGAEEIMPSNPKYFDTVYFAGADPGMKFTILSARIRPVFQTHPAAGSVVAFGDVAAYDINRMTLVNAVRDMFGLCFYTDDLEHKVYVEPRIIFYRDDAVVDWSDRVDLSRTTRLCELAVEVPDTLTWEYRAGDAASAAYNVSYGGHLGRWSAVVGNPWKEGESKTYRNTLFTTSVNVSGTIPSAPSASLPAAGSTAVSENDRDDDLNFPVKVVRYLGMKELPQGERWGWPSFGISYPLSAFHFTGTADAVVRPQSPSGDTVSRPVENTQEGGFTLCYEDRDGLAGLHRWWDSLVDTYSRSRRLEAWLRLYPEDVEALVRPNYLMQDFRARFRMHIDGEWGDWRLEEVCDYNPSAASTKCIFTKIV